jgi:hypothetical protein
MKKVELIQQNHDVKIGDVCRFIEPNVKEDCIFTVDGVPVGFYIRNIDGKLKQYIDIANAELLSDRVPKSVMARSSAVNARREGGKGVEQYSTIIGSVPPKPHMRRPYPTMSSVHNVKSAATFVKAMLLACREAEAVVKKIVPEIYEQQVKLIEENVPEKWRFSKMFTSSISNFNIAAPFHIDAGNIQGCVNVIITKRKDSTGGCTTVPDYGATIDSCDSSMLVYPAWRNVHGVTPIIPTKEGGYRNSLVFYPLKAFKGL